MPVGSCGAFFFFSITALEYRDRLYQEANLRLSGAGLPCDLLHRNGARQGYLGILSSTMVCGRCSRYWDSRNGIQDVNVRGLLYSK